MAAPHGRFWLLLATAVAFASGCSAGSSTPYHRADVIAIGAQVLPEGTLRHNVLRSTDKGFDRIVVVLPERLSRPAGRTETCFGNWQLALDMKNGNSLVYASCRQPAWVNGVVQAMQALPNACYEPNDAQPYLDSEPRSC